MARKSKGEEAFGWLETPTRNTAAEDTGFPVAGEVPDGNHQPKRRRNRAKTGKRSNPDYVLAGAYIDGRVRQRVDEALTDLREPGKKKTEYSDLVQGLLVRWLEEVGWSIEQDQPPKRTR